MLLSKLLENSQVELWFSVEKSLFKRLWDTIRSPIGSLLQIRAQSCLGVNLRAEA